MTLINFLPHHKSLQFDHNDLNLPQSILTGTTPQQQEVQCLTEAAECAEGATTAGRYKAKERKATEIAARAQAQIEHTRTNS